MASFTHHNYFEINQCYIISINFFNLLHCMDVSQFICSPASGYLGYFQVWAILNKVAIKMQLKSLCEHVLFLLSIFLGVGLLDHRVNVCLTV